MLSSSVDFQVVGGEGVVGSGEKVVVVVVVVAAVGWHGGFDSSMTDRRWKLCWGICQEEWRLSARVSCAASGSGFGRCTRCRKRGGESSRPAPVFFAWGRG